MYEKLTEDDRAGVLAARLRNVELAHFNLDTSLAIAAATGATRVTVSGPSGPEWLDLAVAQQRLEECEQAMTVLRERLEAP